MTIAAEPIPLRIDEAGVIRIGSTRVALSSVVAAFAQGATPEQIAQDFSSLELPDVYSAIGYYLRHQRELDEHFAQEIQHAAEVHDRHKDLYATSVRERLLARSQASRAK